MRFKIIVLALILALLLGSCAVESPAEDDISPPPPTVKPDVPVMPPVPDEKPADEPEAAFEIRGSAGGVKFDAAANVFTIVAGGEYELSGALTEGRVIVDAGDEDVVISLVGCTITNSTDAPVSIISAKNVELSAKKGTENAIYDMREAKNGDPSGGAVFAECDLTIKGGGALEVVSNYNNGIHTKDDLTIKNLTLTVRAVNNAIRGNDSVTIESGTVTAVSSAGDAVKTSSTDLSKKGKQRGSVAITGGTVELFAARDGIDCASDATVSGGAALTIHAGPTALDESVSVSEKPEYSCMGIKADNTVTIAGGVIAIVSIGDGIHADSGNRLESTGENGLGNILISGGEVTVSSGDDGLHADQDLRITGGTVRVVESHEGLEANRIFLSGGEAAVFAGDDAVNANNKGKYEAFIEITGGLLDATVPEGDTDTMDSNGNITMTGGTVILRCGASDGEGNRGAIDADGTVLITGGTLIAVGSAANVPDGCFYDGSVRLPAGEYSILDAEGNAVAGFSLGVSYEGFMCRADAIKKGGTYTVCSGGEVFSFTA